MITDATKLRLGYEWEAQLWRRRVPKKTLLSKFKIMGKEELDKLVVVSGWPWAGGHAQLGRVVGGERAHALGDAAAQALHHGHEQGRARKAGGGGRWGQAGSSQCEECMRPRSHQALVIRSPGHRRGPKGPKRGKVTHSTAALPPRRT